MTLSDLKVPVSSKGKGREDVNWHLGWWELSHLISGPRRPIAWSAASVIFTAHPNQPCILAHHFPSSRPISIPNPASVATSPSFYAPPSLITIAPTDKWLFAYFPGRGREGIACLWKRGSTLDSWTVRDWWNTSSSQGGGLVAAEWASSHRGWTFTDAGLSARYPPRGPLIPMPGPILLLVTQTHQVNVCFLPPAVPSLKILRGSLVQPSNTLDAQFIPEDDAARGPGGRKVCVSAAIGMNYNQSSIIVAMRSCLLPTHNFSETSFDTDAMDLDIPLNLSQSDNTAEALPADEGELWGEEVTIGLCEVQIDFKIHMDEKTPSSISLSTKPFPPLSRAGAHLSDLKFHSVPPVFAGSSSPTKDPRRQHAENEVDKAGTLYLAATFTDFGDYTSNPKSEISLYTFARRDVPSGSSPAWVASLAANRSFDSSLPAFLVPSTTNHDLFIGSLDFQGTIPHQNYSKVVRVGTISVLKLPDLTDDNTWQGVPIMSPREYTGSFVLANVATSPNHSLVCSIPPSSSMNLHTSIHALPHPQLTAPSHHSITNPLASMFLSSFRQRTSPSDIIRVLIQPTTTLEAVQETLYGVLSLLVNDSYGLGDSYLRDSLGLHIEVYSRRAVSLKDSAEKRLLEARCKTALDVCSLVALCSAFEECKEGDGYEYGAAWQLIDLSRWFIEFLEKLMRDSILVGDWWASISTPEGQRGDIISSSLSSSSPLANPLEYPALLHLIHPYALSYVHSALTHVVRWRAFVGGKSPGTQSTRIAKEELIDIVDQAGINVGALAALLADLLKDAKSAPPDELRLCLAHCAPVPALLPRLRTALLKLHVSPALSRPRLFLTPSELLDVRSPPKTHEVDIILKAPILSQQDMLVCMRCGGKTELGASDRGALPLTKTWDRWERIWEERCVCGGAWARAER